MKTLIHNITALFLSIIVLFSTMSFTINIHYCNDTLVDTSFYGELETCCMESSKTTSCLACSSTKSEKNCCDEKQISIQGQEDLMFVNSFLSKIQQVFLTSYIYTYKNLFEGLEEGITPFKEYSPPLIVKDIQLLDEVYLI